MKDTMKNILLILLIATTFFLQSCDERITPNSNTPEVIPPTKTEILISQAWQYNEIVVRGGGKTVVQFSRPNSINLSSDFSTVLTTYKADGTYSSAASSGTTTGKWQFLADETQIALTNANGKRQVFDISVLSKEKFDYTQTTKKSDVGDDSLWALVLTPYGLPVTATEIVVAISTIPK
jgi:hypothetical protein